MIIVPAARIAEFSGEVIPGHALAPRLLVSGDGALPERVLEDPAFASLHDALAELDRREISAEEWAPELEE